MQREYYTPLSRTPRRCQMCGGTFTSKEAKAKFCSHACSNRARRKHHPKPCGRCGGMFTPKDAQSTFCSNACAGKARRSGRSWKDPYGYIMRYEPEHPMASRRGRLFEHRWVMANHLGRPLLPDEIVHHRNGVKDDNRIDNLAVMTDAEHKLLHTAKRSRTERGTLMPARDESWG